MINREQPIYTVLLAVIDHDDIETLANLFPDKKRRDNIISNAMLFAEDGYPIVASLTFYKECTELDFQFRYADLEPGDGGEVKYFENYIYHPKADDGSVVAEQICFNTFLRILQMSDPDKITVPDFRTA